LDYDYRVHEFFDGGYRLGLHLPRLDRDDHRREEVVPLSEEELRLLEQMERALVAEDPKLASTLRGTTLRRNARRRSLVAAVIFLIGVTVLMTGAVMRLTVVGIVGFVVMLASSYVALTSWRGQAPGVEESGPEPDAHGSFSVIDGGKAKKRGPRGKATRQQHSLMDRFEERWRRRRDQNGGF
jgi:Protein of unknown function (DUF3040)